MLENEEWLTLCMLGNLACVPIFFFKINFFQKNYFRNTIRVSNILDPNQVRHFIGPDLSQNCLRRMSSGTKSYY